MSIGLADGIAGAGGTVASPARAAEARRAAFGTLADELKIDDRAITGRLAAADITNHARFNLAGERAARRA